MLDTRESAPISLPVNSRWRGRTAALLSPVREAEPAEAPSLPIRQPTRSRWSAIPGSVGGRVSFQGPLPGLLFAATLSGLCGAFLHPNGYAFLAALLAVLILGVACPLVATCRLKAYLEFEHARIREDEPAHALLRITNRGFWPAFGLVVGGRGFPVGVGLPGSSARPRGRQEVRGNLGRLPRGKYPLAPLSLVSAFPLALVEAGPAIEVPAALLVWPRTFPVGEMPEPDCPLQREGNFESRRVGTGGDLAGLRPYRQGDSLRQIHWRQTARHDRLIVCERHATRVPRIQVLLDTDPRSHVGAGGDGTLEWAIRAAASLGETWANQGAEVLACFGDRVLPGAGGQRQVRDLLDLAARVPAAGCSLQDTWRAAERCRDGSPRVLVCTDRSLEHHQAFPAEPDLWLVVLHCAGFSSEAQSATVRRARVLHVADAASMPMALHRGWLQSAGGR